jgi:membrane fusion protein (multidrug efflux system)
MKASRARSFILLSVSLSLSVCNAYGQKPRDDGRKVTVATLQPKAVTITKKSVCRIESHRHIEVRAPAAGYVEATPIKEGQAVRRGDLLLQVRPLKAEEKADDEKEGKDVSVKAPFDGLIDRLSRQRGSLVREGEALTSLFDNSVMWVYFDVPEGTYLEYMAGRDRDKVERQVELVLVNGRKFKHPGKLGAIEARFNPETGSIPFRADFPNPEGLLRHGQTGTVLIGQVQPDAIAVPQRATFEDHGKRFVYVLDKGDAAHRREIVVKDEVDDLFVVESGVGAGDRIVVEGVRLVRDGHKVEY